MGLAEHGPICAHQPLPPIVACTQGGMPGAQALHDSQHLAQLLREQKESGRLVAAICAAPAVVLQAQGLLEGVAATSHPGFVEKLADQRRACRPPFLLQGGGGVV